MFAKTVLCILGMKDGGVDLDRATGICREFDMHLSVLVIGISAQPTIGEYPLGAVSVDKRDAEIVALREQEKKARTSCEAAGVSFDISSIYVEMAWADDEIAERVRYADPVVIGDSVLRDEDLKRQTVNGTLFASERPVLVMAHGAQPTLKPKTILLAWDSGAQAARATYDMRELIAAADSVHVTMVDPIASWRRNGDEPGADVATYLARYGASVVVDRLARLGRPVADVLTQHAVDINANLIVMGAYSHTRLRERLLGGVTRTMLDDPVVPLLMSR